VNRIGPGIAFVAAILYGGGTGSGAREIATYDEHHAARQVAGFAVLLAGCVLLLVFVVRAAAGDLLATAMRPGLQPRSPWSSSAATTRPGARDRLLVRAARRLRRLDRRGGGIRERGVTAPRSRTFR